ncbi:hypothetical protein N9916_00185 [Akkermansiaceae bacterium]|nr:hypothetical protein [Akkermansiaceae bacterium]MDB4318758.1 hypothetical protein [Akkermansiaceae bacterium]
MFLSSAALSAGENENPNHRGELMPLEIKGKVDPKLKRHLLRIIHESLRRKEIKELTLEEVREWKASPDRIKDEVTYQTGVVTYDADTIFGERKVSLQAWIKDGKVHQWTFLRSGIPVK